jgi:hypothetical protein
MIGINIPHVCLYQARIEVNLPRVCLYQDKIEVNLAYVCACIKSGLGLTYHMCVHVSTQDWD